MDEKQLIEDILKVFSGDWKSMAAKLVMALVLAGGWFLLKRWWKNAKIDEAKKATEEGQARDQADNKDEAKTVQDQLNSTKTELDKVREEVKAKEKVMGGKLPKHENSGKCPRCAVIFDAFPGFYAPLRLWFEFFQGLHPEAHVSCAGRGKEAQEKCVLEKTSRAHYGDSSHNWNAAIDLFELGGEPKNIYESNWFMTVLRPELDNHPEFNWYGRPDAEFQELPHIEIAKWRELALNDIIKLVELKV